MSKKSLVIWLVVVGTLMVTGAQAVEITGVTIHAASDETRRQAYKYTPIFRPNLGSASTG